MVTKRVVATALLLVGCAPEVAAVPTTSANVPSSRIEVRSEPPAEAPPAEAKARSPGAAALVLSVILLIPFITLSPNTTRVENLYFPIPSFAPASTLPSGELPGTTEVISVLGLPPLGKAWTP